MCGAFLSEADREAFSALSRALGVQDRVVDHGSSSRSELARLLSQADIGLLSSRSEGQPNSVMEYMGFGLPVVGTRIPGIRELLGPDGEEWLFDVGDAEGFAGAVRHLAEDAALRAKIGRSNRRRITEVYAPERVLPRWGELLEPSAAPGSEHPAAVPGPGGRFRRS
jgi:glycosyltransferase involved in cell wall biosynthesis